MFDRVFTAIDLIWAFTVGLLLPTLGFYWGLRAKRRKQAEAPRRHQAASGRVYERVNGSEMLMNGFVLGLGECCTGVVDGLQILSIGDPRTNEAKVVLPMKAALPLSRGMLRACAENLRHNSGEEFGQQLGLACDHITAAAEVFQE